MSKHTFALMASTLALAGFAALVTGCGGSSGNGTDGGPDTMQMGDTGKPDHHMPPPTDGGHDAKPMKDGGGKDTGPGCQTLPEFVDDLIKTETKSTNDPVAIPTCGEWNALTPTGTAKPSTTDPQTAAEFTPLP